MSDPSGSGPPSTDLFWPGAGRAGDLLGDASYLAHLVRVEEAWLGALVGAGIAPVDTSPDLEGLVGPDDLPALAGAAEAGGNPVIPLVGLLRERLAPTRPDAARWLHRGLTSQDVVDTALVLGARDALGRLGLELAGQLATLAVLADTHRATPMVARTLTQHAVPTTFGVKAAQWLAGVLEAHDALRDLDLPAQLGGAAGTMAAATELLGDRADPEGAVLDLTRAAAASLGLSCPPPWHTHRGHLTRVGDAAVACTDAWGRIANDVLALGRPEVGELSEGAGGGSSTMPHKANPVLSVLVRRAALTGPALAATLHLAASAQVDERADGGWHAEWATLRDLLRRTVVAASQTSDLLAGLRVHPERMAATLAAAGDDVRTEQRAMAGLAGREPAPAYLGAAATYVDDTVARAWARLEGAPR